MRNKKIFYFAIIFLSLCLSACATHPTANFDAPKNIDAFFEQVFRDNTVRRPEFISSLGLQAQYDAGADSKLNNRSDEFEHQDTELARRHLAGLKKFDRASLSAEQKLSYDVLEQKLTENLSGEPFFYHHYVLTQLDGIHNDFPNLMLNVHQLKNENDARSYLARLQQFPARVEEVLAALKEREKRGIIPPRFAVEKPIAAMKKFIAQPVDDNPLAGNFFKQVKKLNIGPTEKELWQAKASASVAQYVYPAYQKLIHYYETLLPKAVANNGVWSLPSGDAYYAHMLRQNTTTDLTPEAVHQLGLAEVARIKSEMRTLLDSLGYNGHTVGQDLARMAADPRQKYPDASDKTKQQVLADYQKIIDDIEVTIAPSFDLRPSAKVEVRPVPAHAEQSSPGAYYDSPSMDGSRPGVFYRNLVDMNDVEKYGMKTLAYHEAVPGHHFQIAIAQQLKVPSFRKHYFTTAYTEGWALYGERLAWEAGVYRDDPHGNLGRLDGELFRAKRLVVDTGMHYKRWTREQAIEYMSDGQSPPTSDTIVEIERYMVWPGQACGYKIGQLKILALREKARKTLGVKFDIRQFHNAILADGAMPLALLEQVVDQYISRKN